MKRDELENIHINSINLTSRKGCGDPKQNQVQIIQNNEKKEIINTNDDNENKVKLNIKENASKIQENTSSIQKIANPVEEKIREQNLTSNIVFILRVISEREKLLQNISQPNGNRHESTKQYYLISKNYMSEINSMFHINDIYAIIQKNQRINEPEIIKFIKENLEENKKMELDCLSKENIQKSLDRKEIYDFNHYYVNNDKSTNLLYYKNCDIISGNILNSFRTIDKNINKKVQIVECIFDKSAIVLFIKKQIINIDKYNNGITETKYIIVSSGQNNNFNMQQIFQVFGNEGIDNFMKKYVKSNLIQFNINLVNQQYLVQANIYKINSNGEIEDEYKPSSKLKTLLLLSISQQYNIGQSKDEKVYLINPEWLKELQYEKIKSFVYQKTYGRTDIWNYTYNIDSILNIFQNADNNILKAYDSQLNIQPRNNWQIPAETITLLDNKYIDLYKQFVLVNEKMFEQIKNNFGITPTKENIFHIYSNTDGDFIIFKNYQLRIPQNSNNMLNYILVGNINKEKYEFDIKHIFDYNDKKKYEFDIKHIFDYNDKNILESELQTILSIKIHNYISQRTFLSSHNNNGNFSPIFYNNKLIGNYYKYGKDFNIGNCINYSKYIKNKKLLTSIYLYINGLSISNKLKGNKIYDEEFYFIKKDIILYIKEKNSYDQLKKYFIGKINNIPDDIFLYSFVQTLPQNVLNDLDNEGNFQKGLPTSLEIDIIPIINPINQNEVYMILNDFYLVDKNLYNRFLANYPYHILKCSIIGNEWIIFQYPNNKFGNKYYICVISKIEQNHTFTNEYYLIYKEPKYFHKHFKNIKNNLNNFLKSISFVNNVAPIVENGYIEIGIVIPPPPPPPPPSEDEYFSDIPITITKSRQDFNSKPLIGFENIGATCYMNATLQCICNIEKFVDYFKYSKHLFKIVKEDIKKEKLCSQFKLIIEKLYPDRRSNNYKNYLNNKPNPKITSRKKNLKPFFPPTKFKNTISIMNPLFEGIAANDAKDLVNFLIMTLHAELNRAPPEEINMGNLLQDQTNKQLMLQNFASNFTKTHQSIISDIFYAMNCNVTQCLNCGVTSYNYQIYFFLIFPLEEVRKFVLMNNSGFNNNFNTNMVNIYDCFNFDRKINSMSGDNAM